MSADTARLLAELPAIEPVEVPAGYGVTVSAPGAKRSRSGTSGAERRRRAKADPAAAADSAPGKPAVKRAPVRRPPLNERVTQSVTLIGVGVGLLNQGDGMAIVSGAPALGDALAKLAEENPRVRKALEGAMAASAWGGVLAATLPIAAAIAANHGALPAGMAEAMLGTAPAAAPFEGAPLAPVA